MFDPETKTWSIDYPEGVEPNPADLSWVCGSDPVWSSTEATPVTLAGEYKSEDFTPTEYGKFL